MRQYALIVHVTPYTLGVTKKHDTLSYFGNTLVQRTDTKATIFSHKVLMVSD